MRRTRAVAVAAAIGIGTTAVVGVGGGPAQAVTAQSLPACRGTQVTLGQLAAGCTPASGTVVVVGGRTMTIPSPGVTVTAAPVAAVGSVDPGDVSVTNTGRTGVAIRLDDTWTGAPAAVRQERAATQRRSLAATLAQPATARGTTVAASCGSKAYTALGYRWASVVSWSYNPNNQKVSGAAAIGAGADAWTGRISSCGKTVTSRADDTYRGVLKRAMGVTAKGGCGSSDGSSVAGWGSLSSGVLAVTCVWSRSGTATEVDQRYSTGHVWSATTTCSGSRYDLRGVATHEWGHAYGLGHTPQASGLVMKPASAPCDTAQRTLGLGDVLGIAAVG